MENSTKIAIVAILIMSGSFALYYNRTFLPTSCKEFLHYDMVRYNPLSGPVVYEGPARSEKAEDSGTPYLSTKLVCNTHNANQTGKWFCKGNRDLASIMRINDVQVRGIVTNPKGPIEDFQVDIDLDVFRAPDPDQGQPEVKSAQASTPPPDNGRPSCECHSHSQSTEKLSSSRDYVPPQGASGDRDNMCNRCPGCRGEVRAPPPCECHSREQERPADTQPQQTTPAPTTTTTPPPTTQSSSSYCNRHSSGCCCCCRERWERGESHTNGAGAAANGGGDTNGSRNRDTTAAASSEKNSIWEWTKWFLWILWKALPYIVFLLLVAYLIYSGTADRVTSHGRNIFSRTVEESAPVTKNISAASKEPTKVVPSSEKPMSSPQTIHSSGYQNVTMRQSRYSTPASKVSPSPSPGMQSKPVTKVERSTITSTEVKAQVRPLGKSQPGGPSNATGKFFRISSKTVRPANKAVKETEKTPMPKPAKSYYSVGQTALKNTSNLSSKKGSLNIKVVPSVFSPGSHDDLHYSIRLDSSEGEDTPKLNDESGCALDKKSARSKGNNFQLNSSKNFKRDK